jgi:hypothetical protein
LTDDLQPEPTASEEGFAPPARPRPSRRTLALILAPIVVLYVGGILADIFAAAIIEEHPLVQLFLNPRLRYLALVANNLDPLPYYAVGFFRLVATDPLFYLLGVFYGHGALRWVERKMGDSDGFIRMIERGFAKRSRLIVFLVPNYLVCVMAGAAGMGLATFVALNAAGTAMRLVLVRLFAKAFEAPLDAFLGFITRYRWWIVGLSALLFGLQAVTKKRKGESELESPSRMADELEAEARAVEAEAAEERDR